MKRKVLFLIGLICVVCVSTTSAQNATEAKKVLDKTAAIVGRKGGAKANFSLSGGKYATSNGVIAIKGNKFHASTGEAMVWYNGKTQWTYMKSTNEVNISTPNEAQQMSMNPYKFITMYKNGYNLGMTTSGNSYQVHLTAQNPKKSVQEMYIMIDKKSYHPTQVKMKQGSNWTTIKISNFQAKNQDDGIFTFNAKDFPSAEVIDLRD